MLHIFAYYMHSVRYYALNIFNECINIDSLLSTEEIKIRTEWECYVVAHSEQLAETNHLILW